MSNNVDTTVAGSNPALSATFFSQNPTRSCDFSRSPQPKIHHMDSHDRQVIGVYPKILGILYSGTLPKSVT